MTPSYNVKFNWDFIFRSKLCALHIWQTHNNGNKVTFKITNNYRVLETHSMNVQNYGIFILTMTVTHSTASVYLKY